MGSVMFAKSVGAFLHASRDFSWSLVVVTFACGNNLTTKDDTNFVAAELHSVILNWRYLIYLYNVKHNMYVKQPPQETHDS